MAGIRYKGKIFSGSASTKSADEVSYDDSWTDLKANNVQSALENIAIYGYYPFSSCFTINSGITINTSNFIKVAPHLAYFHLDISGTFGAGQTVIGSCEDEVIKEVSYVSGRCTSNGSVYPATGVLIPNGQIRVHCHGASTAVVLNGFVLV